MSELSTSRRSYHSPARQNAAAAPRERIIDPGPRLVRGFTTWDWDELTFRAVAERAGVSERTVYRNFPSERHLHDALNRAVAARAPKLAEAQRRALAGLLDVLWSPPTYERLIGAWNLDNTEAIGAVQWLIAKVIAAGENNEPPNISA